MADLAGLIEKVKVATGEDRVIDAQLAYIINYDVDMDISFRTYCENFNLSWPEIAKRAGWRQNILFHNLPRWSASLDAVVALADEALGGVMWRVQSDPDTGDWFQATVITPTSDATAEGATPALALLLAILTAKEASNG